MWHPRIRAWPSCRPERKASRARWRSFAGHARPWVDADHLFVHTVTTTRRLDPTDRRVGFCFSLSQRVAGGLTSHPHMATPLHRARVGLQRLCRVVGSATSGSMICQKCAHDNDSRVALYRAVDGIGVAGYQRRMGRGHTFGNRIGGCSRHGLPHNLPFLTCEVGTWNRVSSRDSWA